MMGDETQVLVEKALDEVARSASTESLETLRVHYLGRKGVLTRHLTAVGHLPPKQRPEAGRAVNQAKRLLKEAFAAREPELLSLALQQRVANERIDVTLPGRGQQHGALHPVTLTLRRVQDFFSRQGFEVVTGPEVEDDFHNFTALNIPPHHPARAMHDTFYFRDGRLLRTHTSPVQIRTMEKRSFPLKIIAPGRVYRCDSDVTHSPMFHQVEGLLVDQNVSFADLKTIIEVFLRSFFDNRGLANSLQALRTFRLPNHPLKSISRDNRGNWLEIIGCGMVHPKVLRATDSDNCEWSGLCFRVGDRAPSRCCAMVSAMYGGFLKMTCAFSSSSSNSA